MKGDIAMTTDHIDINGAPGALSFTRVFKVTNGRVPKEHYNPYESCEHLRPVPFHDGWYFSDISFIGQTGPFPSQVSAKRAALEYEKPFYLKDGPGKSAPGRCIPAECS
jgi:hypothetical protein